MSHKKGAIGLYGLISNDYTTFRIFFCFYVVQKLKIIVYISRRRGPISFNNNKCLIHLKIVFVEKYTEH